MKKAFMSLKFHDGEEDKKKIEDLTQALLKAGIKNVVMARDAEKGVGLGIGAGYAYAIGLPIYVIAKTGSDISLTISNLAKEVIFYDDPSELTEKFRRLV